MEKPPELEPVLQMEERLFTEDDVDLIDLQYRIKEERMKNLVAQTLQTVEPVPIVEQKKRLHRHESIEYDEKMGKWVIKKAD